MTCAIVRADHLECERCRFRLYPDPHGGFGPGMFMRPPKLSLWERVQLWWFERFGRDE